MVSGSSAVSSWRSEFAMKKVLLVLLLCGVAVGFYRGWFTLSSHRREENNQVDVSLTVNPDKAREDAAIAKDKTSDLGDRAKDKMKPNHQ